MADYQLSYTGDQVNTAIGQIVDKNITGTLTIETLDLTNPLAITQGGTGKTTVAEALMALGGCRIEKVWGNASPTSQFNAQFVSISNLQDSDLIIITGRYSIGAHNSFVGVYKTAVETKGVISIALSAIANREFTVKNDGVQFDDGKLLSTYGGNATTNNTVVIPTEIYGVKGVI